MKKYKHTGKNIKPDDNGEWMSAEEVTAELKAIRVKAHEAAHARIEGLRRGLILNNHYMENKERYDDPYLLANDAGWQERMEAEAMHKYTTSAVFNSQVTSQLFFLLDMMHKSEEGKLDEVQKMP